MKQIYSTLLFLLISTISFSQTANILSIERENPATETTDENQVTFRVTFDKAVLNVDLSDFALSGTAAGDGTVSTVTPISTSIYDVTVTGLTDSNGTLNLDIKGNGGVSGSNDIEELSGAFLSQTSVGNTISQPEIGQSFTSSVTGELIDFTFYMHVAATYNGTGTLELLSGEGLTGAVLATETVTFIDQPTAYTQKFTFSTPATVTSGNVYTIRIAGPFGNLLTFDALTGDPFAGGIIYIPYALASADLTFEATISTGAGGVLSTTAPAIDESYTISNTLSISDSELVNNKLKLYPNPSTNYIKISGITNTKNYKIINEIGQEVLSGNIIDNQEIDIKILNNGFYFMKLDNGSILKFMKE